MVEGIGRCRTAFRAAHAADLAFEIAVVEVLASPDSLATSIGHQQFSAWAALAYGPTSYHLPESLPESVLNPIAGVTPDWNGVLGDRAQRRAESSIAFHPTLFAQVNQRAASSAMMSPAALDVAVLVRLPLIWQSGSVFLEAGVRGTFATSGTGTASVQYPAGIGAEIRVSDGTWLGAYFGGRDVQNTREFFSLANLRWSFGETRPFGG